MKLADNVCKFNYICQVNGVKLVVITFSLVCVCVCVCVCNVLTQFRWFEWVE